MVDDCPMTEDCPGYDRDRRMCLIHPGDCEFAPVDGETVERPASAPTDRPRGTVANRRMAVARPTGVGRAITTYSMPIEGRDEWIAAVGRLA